MNEFETHAERFLNFEGSSFGADPNSLIGGQDYYGGGSNYGSTYPAHQMYQGEEANNNLGTIDEADRTLTITISNDGSSGNPRELARVFGSFTNAGLVQPQGVIVEAVETNHQQVATEASINPFLIVGLKYLVTNVAQFSNNITIFSQTSTGTTLQKTLQPLTYRSAMNQVATQIDAPAYSFAVDGRTEFQVPINANEELTFIFQLKTRGDITNILRGKGVVNIAQGKAPTGIPQFDIPRGAR